jgi:hypothetical protein
MKKVFTVSAVLILFLVLCTAQHSRAQQDPFEIGKEIALSGNVSGPVWAHYEGNFGATYHTELNAVALIDSPGSGDGLVVWWIKNLGPGTYSKYTFFVKNNEVQEEGAQEVPITKEQAEQEAWRILGHLGYSQ